MDNWFVRLLGQRWHVEVSDRPDVLIYSWFGTSHLDHACTKVYFAGECDAPDFDLCDFALTFEHLDDPRHLRLPLFLLYFDIAELVKPPDFDAEARIARKSGFCNFVYSNPRCRRRNAFMAKLGRYKRVDSGGKWMNNIGGPVADKLEFVSRYKFTIAFENREHPGYTTEKLVEPMRVDSLPIYWGSPTVGRDFDTSSFVHVSAGMSDEEAIERIIALDRDPAAHAAMLSRPWLVDNRVPEAFTSTRILDFFERIVDASRATPVRTRRSFRPIYKAVKRVSNWYRFRPYGRLDALHDAVLPSHLRLKP